MSRKNNLQRRKTQADFDRRREEELKAKQEAKRQRKAANFQARQEEQHMEAPAPGEFVPTAAQAVCAPAAAAGGLRPSTLAVSGGAVAKAQRRQKNKGFRLKKNGACQSPRRRSDTGKGDSWPKARRDSRSLVPQLL